MGDMADRDRRHGCLMFFNPLLIVRGVFGVAIIWGLFMWKLTYSGLTMERCQQSPKFRPRANYFQTPDLLNFAQVGSFSSGHVPAISKKKLQMRFFCTLLYLWRPIEQMINIAQYTRVAQSGKMEESEVFMFFLTGKLFFNQSPFTEQDHSTKSNVSWDWQFWSIC